ncbi:MAG TPA: FtsX-like permease family protein [Bacteroidetes bacterium]|nr:FtsX-like permease family protein [Bacteroidota bacterium]
MNFKESLEIGTTGLLAHKLRSFLTVLGIIFGVAAVIAMLSIGEGAKQEALQQISQLGIQNILIKSKPIVEGNEQNGKTVLKSAGLTINDGWAILKNNPLIGDFLPILDTSLDVAHGSDRVKINLIGTFPNYPEMMDVSPSSGGFFNFQDEKERRKVCVLGNAVRKKLFYFKNPVGKKIKIGDLWFTVVGTLPPRLQGTGSFKNFQDMNRDVYIPFSTSRARFFREASQGQLDWLVVRAKNPDRIQEAANLVSIQLKKRHRDQVDFQIVVPEALVRQRQKTQHIFNIVMGAIAGISLLVGGIGIMNIMLASVMERTREIGIRRAVGATRQDILIQFMIEAIILSAIGGVLGIFIGFALTKLITLYASWRTIISPGSVILAFSVSAAVGILFGIFPARKAALLDPIESLRYE